MLKRILGLLLIASTALAGNTYFAATNGSAGGNGTIGSPWDLRTACAMTNKNGGDTCYIRGGTYFGNGWEFMQPGSSDNAPFIYRNYNGERARIIDNSGNEIIVFIKGNYCWLWGLEIASVVYPSVSNSGAVQMAGYHSKIINCLIHDSQSMGIACQQVEGTEIYGNLLTYCGNFLPPPPSSQAFGYGIYIQNVIGSGPKYVTDNIIAFTWAFGLHAYTQGASIDKIVFAGNTVYGSGLFWRGIRWESNFLVGSTGIAGDRDSVRDGNVFYHGPAYPYGKNYLALYTNVTNAYVNGNYFISTNNGIAFELDGAGTFSNNVVAGGTNVSGGSGNTYYTSWPSSRSTDIIIRPNKYEAGRANITIINWASNSTVAVNISSVLSPGDHYRVMDALNFYGSPVDSGTYGGGSITLPMTGGTPATPLGSPATGPYEETTFRVFVLLKTGAGVNQPATPPAPLALAASALTNTSFSANWQASSGATSYRLDVSTSPTFASFVGSYNDLNVGNVTTYPVAGLSAQTTYYFRARAVNAVGTSSSSNTITVITAANPQPPTAPVATAATNITPASLVAHWNASATATAYFIDVSLASNFLSMISGYNNLNVGNNTSVSVTGLAEQTIYYYRVRASNANGTSGNSNTISATTTAQPPVAPNPPVAIAASSITQSSFLAQWNAASGATAYWLDVSTSPGFGTFLIGYNNLSMGSSLSRSVTGLSAVTTYYYRVRASNAGGTSGNSNTITVVTGTIPVVPPSAPATKAATSVTYSSFVANWTTRATATGYRIDVSLSPTFATILAGYNNADAGADTLMPVTGLTESTNYYYRVRAFNSSGSSGNSDTATATTDAAPVGPPLPPTAVAASSITDVSFAANWLASESSTNYRLDVSPSIAFDSFVSGYNNLLTGDVTSTSVTGLSAVTTYYVRVRAVNGDGTSSSSNVITVVTGSATIVVPVTPVTTQATSIGNSFFVAHWNPVSNATSYRLDVSVADSFDTFLPGYQDLDVGNVFQRSVTGLFELRTYYYRVRAVNSAGVSDDSNTTSATTTANGLRQVWLFKNP